MGADIKDALRNNEIDSYDYPTDIFTRLDFHIGIKERPSGVDPMIIEGPEEDYGDMERKDRDKVRDQFAERQRKAKPDEKIIITPANVSLRGKAGESDAVFVDGPEEDLGDQERKDRAKVKDHFPERQRKAKDDEKIVITPANVSLRGKKPGDEEEEEDLDDQERKDRAKVKDYFPEREKKAKEEEKIVITPAVLTEKEPEEEEDEETRKARDKVRDEFGERRSIKPAEPEKIIIKPADISLRNKKAKKEKEAAEKARKEKEAKSAAEKARKEKEAKEAAKKARKEKEAKEAAEKARKEQEAKEAAEKAKKEKEAKEAAEK